MTRQINLPEPIATYFATDNGDGEGVGRCFTADAVAKDEGRTYEGVAAIRQWRAGIAGKYSYTSEVLGLEERDGMVVVTQKLTGNFPGSPVDLRYFFRLERGRIAFLEIKP